MPRVVITTVRSATGINKTAGPAYRIIKTTFFVVEATRTSANIAGNGITIGVGREVSESTCQNCLQRNAAIEFGLQQPEEMPLQPKEAEFRQINGPIQYASDAEKKNASIYSDEWKLREIKRDVAEMQGTRPADDIPVFGPLIQGFR